MAIWRRWYPRAFRSGAWYLARSGLPDVALAGSPPVWRPIPGSPAAIGIRSTPRPNRSSTNASRPSILRSSTRETGRPGTTGFAGTVCGSRREPNALTFYAGADDGVILRVDGETVLERNPAVGMHTVARTVELAAGAHQLEVDHWQDGGGRSLNVQWAPVGGTPALLGPTRLFPADPGALGYWLQVAADPIARLRPADLGDRGCGAGRADDLASVLSEGHEPESGRALAPPAYRHCFPHRSAPASSFSSARGRRTRPTGPSSWWDSGNSRPAGSGSLGPSSAPWRESASSCRPDGSHVTYRGSARSACCSGRRGICCSPTTDYWTAAGST